MSATQFTIASEGAAVGDLQTDLFAARDLEVRRVTSAPPEGSKAAGEIALVVAVHAATVAILDLARILLTWVRRKPGAKLHIRSNDGTRTLTLDYETKLVSREEVERLAERHHGQVQRDPAGRPLCRWRVLR